MEIVRVGTTLRRLAILATATTILTSCASSSVPPEWAAAPAPPPAANAALHAAIADPAKLDIANVKLGMDADQAMAALRQTFGQSVMDLKIADESILDTLKITKDMNYPGNRIFHSVHLPDAQDKDIYTNHIFYNIQDAYTGKTSVIIDLARSPGHQTGPAKVYQILQVTRGGLPGVVFEEVSQRVAGKYGIPTQGNQWCAELIDGKCPSDKPYLALYLLKDPVPSIRSVLQLYDPGYGMVGPEAVGPAGEKPSLH